MPTATLTAKGQLTLPKAVRELWGLGPGDRVDFVIAPDGRVEVLPVVGRAREAFGLLYRAGQPAPTVGEMDAARDRAIAEDDRRQREGDDTDAGASGSVRGDAPGRAP